MTCALVARKPEFARNAGRLCPFASKCLKKLSKQRSASSRSSLVSNVVKASN